jgi:hypothetical protein
VSSELSLELAPDALELVGSAAGVESLVNGEERPKGYRAWRGRRNRRFDVGISGVERRRGDAVACARAAPIAMRAVMTPVPL